MGATESLRREHQLLRANLRLLEVAMQMVPPPASSAEGGPFEERRPYGPESGGGMVPEAPFVLREMCWSLARMLEDHIRHEAEALRPYSGQIRGLTQARMARDHADQQIILRDVNILLVGRINVPTSQVVLPLAHLIDELREHMDEEESELFPMVDRIAEARPQEPGLAHDAADRQDNCEAAKAM